MSDSQAECPNDLLFYKCQKGNEPEKGSNEMKATVKINGRRSDSNWINGTVTIDDGSEFRFVAKVYDEPSCFGIKTDQFPGGGNISKLNVYQTGDMHDTRVLSYERGWDEEEETPDDSPIGKAKAEAIIDAIVYKLETIVDMNTTWAKRYDSTM